MSRHSGFIIIDFNEAAGMQCWQYFSYMDFWFGYLVDMTCSRLQELTLVVFFRNLFQFITAEQVTLSFWLLRLVYCIAGITLFYFSSHKPLFVSGWVLWFSLHQHSVWVALTSAKLVLRTLIMSFHRCLSLLQKLKFIASTYIQHSTCPA